MKDETINRCWRAGLGALAAGVLTVAVVACGDSGADCDDPNTPTTEQCPVDNTGVGTPYPIWGTPPPGYTGGNGVNMGGTPGAAGGGYVSGSAGSGNNAGGVPASPGYSGSAPQSPAG